MNADHYNALWRSSAHEAVPYTDDFAEPLLVFPEVIDGAIGQGKATEIDINVSINETTRIGVMTVRDNGIGIANERRLLQWAAKEATDNIHRNGHGLKKNLTKWHSDYTTAKWEIKYRKRGKNIQVISSPFLGPDTQVVEIEDDEVTLMPHGTTIQYEFDMAILGNNATPKSLYYDIREIIRTRYSNTKLNAVKITLQIEAGDLKLSDSSHVDDTLRWKSFHETVKESGIVDTLLSQHRANIDGGYWVFDLYRINISGKESAMKILNAQAEFPTYGNKNMNSSRVYISLDGRMIEAIPIWKLAGRESNHNDFNGLIGFVNFVSNTPSDFNKMPIPCTTKVSFYEPGKVFKEFVTDVGVVIRNTLQATPPPAPRPRVPTPTPTPLMRQLSVTTCPSIPTPAHPSSAAPVINPYTPKPGAPPPKPVAPPLSQVQAQSHVATPPQTPTNIPNLIFRQTSTDILVLENNNTLFTIPYKSSYRTTEEYYKQTLEKIGIVRFKRWAAEQERINQQLN